jgi:hypothetical protein
MVPPKPASSEWWASVDERDIARLKGPAPHLIPRHRKVIMKIMQMHTALQINNAALRPVGSSWTPLASEPRPTAVGQEGVSWEAWRSDKRTIEAKELLDYLETL